MKQYLELLRTAMFTGEEKADRTRTGTLSIFGAQMRFDLREGFPLVTTKKVHFKSVVHELLWFIRGDTNVKYLNDNGVTIWNEWLAPWPKERPIVKVPRIDKAPAPYNGDFSIRGANASRESVDGKLASAWTRMMYRCYDPSAHNFRFYGAKGVTVASHWHDVANYISDVKTLPHWDYKLANWNDFELDKDYFGANQYGPDTCVWLPKDENINCDWLYIKSPDGEEFVVDGYAKAEVALGIKSSTLHRFVTDCVPDTLKGPNKKFKGWEFSIAAPIDGLFRRALVPRGELGPIYGKQWRAWPAPDGRSIDQLAQVIEQIRRDPDSRRHIVSAWNVADLPDMALAPCHCLFQFHVAAGRLSCKVYQRSADLFLGVPFNIASYALLTHMVAQVCDLEVGDLVWTGGDCHIYDNHRGQVVHQLLRTPRKLPTLLLNRGVKNINEFTFDDVTLVNYLHHPAIKGEVAV